MTGSKDAPIIFVNCLLACVAIIGPTCLTVAAAPAPKKSAVKLYGHVDQLASTIHGAGLKIESLTLPTRITDVRMGSPAFYSGVAKDDLLERMQLNGDVLQIAFRRQGKLYGVALKTAPPGGSPTGSAPPTAIRPRTPGTAPRTLQSQVADWKQLSGYDIVFLIDRSGSMDEPATGIDTTKWAYAESLINDFAVESRQFAGRPLKVITFNQGMEISRGVTPDNLSRLFSHYKPEGGTVLLGPLSTALAEHQKEAGKDKLLIAILTDGEPQDYEVVGDAIINATQSMKSQNELQITFLGIGENANGANVLNYYDDGLRAKGAKFDVVDTVSSEDLHSSGLAKALTNVFKRQRSGIESIGQNDLSRMLKQLQNKQSQQR